LAVIAGGGLGKGTGALTIIDLAAAPTQVSDVVMIGTDPESFDISPDGELIAAVLMSYSNRPPNHPRKTNQGQMVLLQRQGRTFQKVQQLPIGPIPQGVTFTADGQHLLVQSHPRKEIQVYSIAELRIKDTGVRIPVPGRPSSIRAAEAPR
jgi:sugar lactone lactonase YvrE